MLVNNSEQEKYFLLILRNTFKRKIQLDNKQCLFNTDHKKKAGSTLNSFCSSSNKRSLHNSCNMTVLTQIIPVSIQSPTCTHVF